MSKIKLYDYQQEIYDKSRVALKTHKRIIVQLATGGGKTVIFSKIALDATSKGSKVTIFVYRSSLFVQTLETLSDFGIKCEGINAKTRKIKDAEAYVCMVQTVKTRFTKKPKYKELLKKSQLVIIDECHRQEYNDLFIKKTLPKYVMGFSATPEREGKKRQLYLDYNIIIQGIISKNELIKRGRLCPLKHYSIKDITNRNKVEKNQFGEFSTASQMIQFDKRKAYGGILLNYELYAPELKCLVFCANIKHAIKMCLEFNNKGYKARFACSKVSKPKYPQDGANNFNKKVAEYNEKLDTYNLINKYWYLTGDQEMILRQFKENKFLILVNVDIYSTGTDIPDLKALIVARVIHSRTLWQQIMGRLSRAYPGKKIGILLDAGGNVDVLGRFEHEYQYSLIHKNVKSEGVTPVKECEKCGGLVKVQCKYCDYCGAKLFKEKETKEAIMKLHEIDAPPVTTPLSPEIKSFVSQSYSTGTNLHKEILREFGKQAFKEYCKSQNYSSRYYGLFLSKMRKR